ncbi:AraC family transcriptional regulator [Paenibacillus montanisoli]|uniref:AraC family transcriptional regulator n=1 Tax=Paenibacillus montanisoli TaxID=2081970 RepID=A0A328U0H7_9BACL|nr:AraC family transcriptional regulator [Paenibacillus montanisoli]RAP75273.1 AraC family transcriptional regulator [Paenibacillus montanisoli]
MGGTGSGKAGLRAVCRESDRELRYDMESMLWRGNLNYIGIVLHESWCVESHSHDHFELCYVASGSGWFSIDGSFFRVSKGDLFLTKPGERHQGAASGDTAFQLYFLGFNFDQLSGLEYDYYRLDMNRAKKDEHQILKQAGDRIMQELRNARPRGEEMVHGIMVQLLVSVLRVFQTDQHAEEVEEQRERPLSNMLDVLDYLHAEVHASHTIEGIAEKFHLSRTHLAREFKRHIGIPLGEYVRNQCLDKAKHDLKETNETVSSIGEKLRFPSIHAFSLFFKRHTGLSPQAFRTVSLASQHGAKR